MKAVEDNHEIVEYYPEDFQWVREDTAHDEEAERWGYHPQTTIMWKMVETQIFWPTKPQMAAIHWSQL